MIAPLYRGLQRLVTERRCAISSGEDVQILCELCRDLFERQRFDAMCGQFNGQGKPIQAATDPTDHSRIVVSEEEGGHGSDGTKYK